MPARESITLLHISDMQFGRNHRFGNLGLPEPDAPFDTLLQRVSDDLAVLEKEGVRPEILIVSGDLAEWGKKSEFEDALAFLRGVSERLAISRRNVVIVPGNHDLNRKLCEAYFAEREGNDEKPLPPYWPKWKHYHWMFQEFYGEEKGIGFTIEEPWSFWELDEFNLVVAGLNSTMVESHKDGTHYGWVGEKQLRRFAERLGPFQERGWLRLGVVHHNVQRGAVEDDENLRDADDLQRILAPSLNLLLHGHTHNGQVGWLGPTLPVLSTGSAALKADVRPAEVPNQYQAIRIWPDRIERWTRRYDPEQKRWIGDTRCSDSGADWHIEHRVQFDSVHGTFDLASPTAPPATARAERREEEERRTRDDFLARVAEVCRLRHRGSEVQPVREQEPRVEYLRVRSPEGPIARVFPVGVCEHGISDEQLEALRSNVFARYRALDPYLPCDVVYGGERASDELIAKASADGIRLLSFVEFQGIIDFRGYVERQTRKLEGDLVYPPLLYVPQHLQYEVGRDRHSTRDALREVLEWLGEPLGRFVLVLGDFGTGKTFLLHELARRIPDELPHLVPVLVELRSLEKASTLHQLIAQHLAAAGEKYIDLAGFPYILREGRIALLFDGFDELAQRVTYQRATEHFETLLQATGGRAKVVVTSRTQHFESDQQVKTALYERTENLPGLRLGRLQQFDEKQILWFLQNLLDDRDAAERRFRLIHDIRDLLGLSHNPRMLSFIANLPEEQLCEAEARTGKITSAELYRLLIERWLTYEYERFQPRGAAPTLTVEERWNAVTAVALYLWPKLERTIHLSELTEEIAGAVDKLTERHLDTQTATHLIGSGTLLVRDEAGVFAFVHQSVMEWLVANRAAEQIRLGVEPDVLSHREMSALMADFFCDLAGREQARAWAVSAVRAAQSEISRAKPNALLVLRRLGHESGEAVDLAGQNLAGQDLRGRDFSRQNLSGANLSGADLTEARLQETNLEGAILTGAILERANLTRANLSSSRLDGARAIGARFLGADLRNANLARADLRCAKLVGAQVFPSTLTGCDLFGAALPDGLRPEMMVSTASSCTSVAFAPTHESAAFANMGEIVVSGHDNG
ncbi:MAG TPA: pentapeptide repeat-containing protein, partial [Longimicrobiaceae bacterium]|nr:pentapeptide repeat-containing protein [Longimicrobiaceae bacterium]